MFKSHLAMGQPFLCVTFPLFEAVLIPSPSTETGGKNPIKFNMIRISSLSAGDLCVKTLH